MSKRSLTPSIRLYGDIREKILRRELRPHDPILPGSELTEAYGISHATVHRVLTRMVDEGLIYRVQGRGSFVAEPETERSLPVQRLVGILMQTEGHLVHDFHAAMVRNLQIHDLWPVTQDIDAASYQEHPERHFRRMLSMNPIAVIADGLAIDYDAVKNTEGKLNRLILIQQCNAAKRVSADMFFSDYSMGGYLLAEHLLGLGHERLAFQVPVGFGPGHPESPIYAPRRSGVLQALAERGRDESRLSMLPLSISDDSFRDLFIAGGGAPTAVVAATDYHAKRLVDRLAGLGLKVPDDIAVTGYYNTPWSEQTSPPLTSVDVNVESIARQVVDHLLKVEADPRTPFVTTLVQPTLVVRDSTLAKGVDHGRG